MSLLENPNVSSLYLDKIGQDLYSGKTVNDIRPAIYGGQVFAQALSAAFETVAEDFLVHSMHAYFIAAGDPKKPIEYQVERLRDGRSILTRHVTAFQGKKVIFNVTASFQCPDKGFEHQVAMPDVVPPDGVISDADLVSSLPEVVRVASIPKHPWPFDNRTIDPPDLMRPEKCEAKSCMWSKAIGPLPTDQRLHQMLLAFQSDTSILGTAMYPHGVNYLDPNVQVATINHTLWIHKEVKVDEWLLFTSESPNATSGRGLSFGHIFNQSGELVASAAQEGVMRIRK